VAFGLAIGATSLQAQTFFGEDTNGTESTQATLVNSVAAENSFLGLLTGVGTEDFDAFTLGQTGPLNLTFPGAGTATLTGSGCVSQITWSACSNPVDNSTSGGTNGFGRYPISSPNYWEAEAGGDFAIDFSNPVAAFGFYGVDIGDFGGVLSLSFLNGATNVSTIGVPHEVGGSAGGNAFFFGYINTAAQFDRVEFGLTGVSGGDLFAFDNMTIGSREQVTGVPEPGTIVLLVSGLLGLVAVSRKRKGGMAAA